MAHGFPTRRRPARRRPARHRAAWFGALLALASGCGAAPPRAQPAEPPRPLRPPDELSDLLVPRLRAGWLLSLRPARWSREPALRSLLEAAVDVDELAGWTRRHGFEPLEVEQVAASGGGERWLVLVRGPFDAPGQVRALGRQMSGLRVVAERPWPRRWGQWGGRALDVTALDGHVVMLGTDTALADRVRGRLRRTAARRPPRRGVSWPASWRDELLRSSVALGWLGPLELSPRTPVGLLLSGTEAVLATLAPSRPGDAELQLVVRLWGDFPPTAEENFARLVASLGQSGLGRLLGLQAALGTLRVTARDAEVRIELRLPSERFARGLGALLRAEMPEMFDWSDASGTRAASPPERASQPASQPAADPARPSGASQSGS